MSVRHRTLLVDWLGYATTRLEGTESGTVLYMDPGNYNILNGDWEPWKTDLRHPDVGPYDERDGDVVLVTHDHHYDPDAIRRVAADDATLVVYEATDAAEVADEYETISVEYGDELTVEGVDVAVTPAYNRPDGPRGRGPNGKPYHPEGFGCGFHVTIDNVACFWTGDSDVLNEHHDLDVSLLIPSIAGNNTMTPATAARLAESLNPDLVLPVQYNTIEKYAQYSDAFAADIASRGVPAVLDEGDGQFSNAD